MQGARRRGARKEQGLGALGNARKRTPIISSICSIMADSCANSRTTFMNSGLLSRLFMSTMALRELCMPSLREATAPAVIMAILMPIMCVLSCVNFSMARRVRMRFFASCAHSAGLCVSFRILFLVSTSMRSSLARSRSMSRTARSAGNGEGGL